jgi:hypothetical protein
MLNQLPFTARRDIDVLLSKSKRVNSHWEVNVRNINLNRAKRLLKMSGFEITNEYRLGNDVSKLIFKEKRE